VSLQVLVKGEERLSDTICDYLSSITVDLLILGSHNLCVSPGDRVSPLPASGSFALRLVKAVTACPVLVVKVNSKGPHLRKHVHTP